MRTQLKKINIGHISIEIFTKIPWEDSISAATTGTIGQHYWKIK